MAKHNAVISTIGIKPTKPNDCLLYPTQTRGEKVKNRG